MIAETPPATTPRASGILEAKRSRGLGPVHPGVAVTIAGTMGFWFALAWHHFAYLNDDLILFGLARQDGLSKEFLAYNVFEHFSPIDHALYWLEMTLRPLDPVAGLGITAVLLTGMLLSLDWLLRELGVEWQRRALGSLFVGISIVTLATTTWWGQAAYIPPAMTAMVLTLAAHLRGCSTGRIRWHVAATAFAVLGFLVSERILFVVAFAIVLDATVVDRFAGWREHVSRLWARRWTYVPLLAVCTGGAVFVRLRYYESVPPARLRDIAGLVVFGWGKWIVPALLNFYSHEGVPRTLEAGILLLTAVAAMALIRMRRSNAGPIAFATFAFLVDYVFLGIGRSGIYSINLVAGDIQYVAWLLPLFVAAACCVELSWPPSLQSARGWITGAVAAALVTCLVVNDVRFVREFKPEGPWDYMTAVRASEGEWSSPSHFVLPLNAPEYVFAPFVDPYGRLEVMLPVIDPAIRVGFAQPGSTPVVIDANGNAVPAAVSPLTSVSGATVTLVENHDNKVESLASGTCITPANVAASVRIAFPTDVTGSPLLLEMRYSVSDTTQVRFTAVSSTGYKVNSRQSTLPSDVHDGVFRLDGEDVAWMQIGEMTPGDRLCIDSVSVGVPLVREPDGTCRNVDWGGNLGSPATCPRALGG